MTEDMCEAELGYHRERQAILLIMHDQDESNIAFNLLEVRSGGLGDGTILVGAARLAHIVISSVTAPGLLNTCAVAAAGAYYDLSEV
jgi:phosphotransacetylase